MPEILRNLTRRKLRSTLTISGIVIGIFALTTMGAMASHFNALLSGGVKYAGSSIDVGAPQGQQAALLPLSTMDQLKAVNGVDAIYPRYSFVADPSAGVSFGPPDMIAYFDPNAMARTGLDLTLASGRQLNQAGAGEVVLGSSMANEFKKKIGDTIDLPVKPKDAQPGFVTHTFKVVGILNSTGTAPDTMALVSAGDSRMLLADSLPPQVRSAIDITQVAMGFMVFGKPGTSTAQLDQIAQNINQQVPGVTAIKPSVTVAGFQSINTTMTAVMTGSALLALVIGGLSVVNTMIMAVSERTREIGLKKALGAHTGRVLREYLMEAATIGLIGGVAGYLLGVVLTTAANILGRSSNLDLFLITPQLTALAIGFAVGLGVVAGIIPALRAARLEPVTALRTSN
jgi:putative ABC transport system permease protein